MKSRTRKSKTRVLIAFGKGIASTLALELAMLFSHSGAEVRAALIDNGSEWVAEAPLKQICGHSVLTVSHQPGWFFAGLKFDAGLVIGPSTLAQQQLTSGLTADPVIDYIKTSCRHLNILQNRQQLPADLEQISSRISFNELPAQPMRCNQFFQKIFADITARLAAQALLKHSTSQIHYEVPPQLKTVAEPCPIWLHRFKTALESSGIMPIDGNQNPDIFISAYDGPQIDCEGKLSTVSPEAKWHDNARLTVSFIAPETADSAINASRQHIQVKRLANGLVVYDQNGPRLLPDVSGQCCFERLAEFLAVNLGRELEKTCDKEPS